MQLIYQTYNISQPRLAYLKTCSQHTYQPTVGHNHLTQTLFYNKVLNISCNLLNFIPKVKNRIVIWVQNGFKFISFSPQKLGELWLGVTAQHHKRLLYYISVARKKITDFLSVHIKIHRARTENTHLSLGIQAQLKNL